MIFTVVTTLMFYDDQHQLVECVEVENPNSITENSPTAAEIYDSLPNDKAERVAYYKTETHYKIQKG